MSSVQRDMVSSKRSGRSCDGRPSQGGQMSKERRRRLILESSDSEVDEYFVCPRGKAVASAGCNEQGVAQDEGARQGKEHRKIEVDKEGAASLFGADAVQGDDSDRLMRASLSGLEKKRCRQPYSADHPAKKAKSEASRFGNGQVGGMGGKKLRQDSQEWEDGEAKLRDSHVMGLKQVMPGTRDRHGLKEKEKKSLSKRDGKLGDEKTTRVECFNREKLQSLKSSGTTLASCKRRENDSFLHGGIRFQGKNGVLKLLSNNKKADEFKKFNCYRRDQDKSMDFGSPNVESFAACKQLGLNEKRKFLDESSSSIKSRKCQAHVEEFSSRLKIKGQDSERHQKTSTTSRRQLKTDSKLEKARFHRPRLKIDKDKSHGAKVEPDVLSAEVKSEDVDMRDSKGSHIVKEESTSNFFLLSKHKISKASVGRNQIKQKVRDQIKNMLLNAGWKIELRPRKGRAYEDSVYVSPQGTGYWSITKAYAVFQDQLNQVNDAKCKGFPERSSKHSDIDLGGASSPLLAIPKGDIDMLKRNVGNKRGKLGLYESEYECEISIDKKERKISNIRQSRKVISASTMHKDLLVDRNKRGCAILVRGANQEAEDGMDHYIPYIWKRTVLSWMIDLEVVPINGKVKYMNKQKTRSMLEGRIRREGIHCSCCSKILTVSKFELHAGSKVHQPYENIFVEDVGASLLQCQLEAWKKQDEVERNGFYNIDVGDDPNDDTCGICGDGGDLICCDSCPSTFHLSCLGIQVLPPGDWHCNNCSCRFCGSVSPLGAKESDTSFSPPLSCSQCGQKYHPACVIERDFALTSNSSTSFCGHSCQKIFKLLQKLLGVRNDFEAGFSWTLIRRFDENSPKSISRLSEMAECNSKIAVAFAVMDECFLPIVDQRSGINLIRNVVYNCRSNFNRLNYSGFYTFVLQRGDEIISVASVRIHGSKLAEMPFIGTRNMYRRQGMCRLLLNAIESALCSLNVEKLIIPAISELKDTWTTVFGFKNLETHQELEVRSVNILVFPDIGLLQKPLLVKHTSKEHNPANEVVCDQKHVQMLEENGFSTLEPKHPASDDLVLDPKNKFSFVGPGFPAPAGSTDTTTIYSAASEIIKVRMDCPSALSTGNANLLANQEAVCHDEPARQGNCQIEFSLESKDELHCKGELDDSCEVNSVKPNDSLKDEFEEDNCILRGSIVSSKLVSPTNPASGILRQEGHMPQHNLETACTSMVVITSTQQEPDGSNRLKEVCPVVAISDPIHLSSPDTAIKSCSPSLEGNLLTRDVHTVTTEESKHMSSIRLVANGNLIIEDPPEQN